MLEGTQIAIFISDQTHFIEIHSILEVLLYFTLSLESYPS